MKNRSRLLPLFVCIQLLVSACGATAHSPLVRVQWPQPKPVPWQEPERVRAQPNFQAPSAANCSRASFARDIAGRHDSQGRPYASPLLRERPAKAGRSAPAPAPAATESRAGASEMAADGVAERSSAWPQPAPAAPQVMPPQQRPATVTAGMVDDNADFAGYLAFRDRTRVQARERDVRERYLLEVKDPRGRPVADAEVAVQSAQGYAMWARTDTGGRAWLHPNAFDPSGASVYEVMVRKDGVQAASFLQRGQKSAVEVVMNARPAASRARLDLVFLIDATGSMADEIGKLKATLRTIAAEVSALPSRPDLCFGLVAYRDREDEFMVRSHDFTNDLGNFQSVLNALYAGGGGDYPEALNEALHETVHNLSWRGSGATRMVVLLADAPPHLDYGGPQYDESMMAALGKGIKVFSVGASGLDRQGEYIQRQIAQYTGGRFVFLTYAQARDPRSGPGRETVHDVKNYSVDTLDRLIVRLVGEELGKSGRGG
jgi:Mg-chelatase subunit ChlD